MSKVSFFAPTDKSIDRKRLMAQAIMEQGKQPESTQVVNGYAVKQSPLSGLAKALTQGLGGAVGAQADAAESQKQDSARQTMAQALEAYSRSQAGGQTQLQDGGSINWNKAPLDKSAQMYQNILMDNPDTAPLGMQAAMEGIAYDTKFPKELELAREKARIEAQFRAPPSSVQEWQYGQSHPEFLKYQQSEGAKSSKVWGDAQQLVAASIAAGQPIDIMTAYGMAKSGLGVGRTMTGGAVSPIPGALDTTGAFKSTEADAQNISDMTYDPQTEAAKVTAAADATQHRSDAQAMPILEDMLKNNEGTFDAPYLTTLQGPAKLAGNQQQTTAFDLMKQNRLNLAAPLAKALGVNPTDKDFQATLERIVDVNATKDSRRAQIKNLQAQIERRQSNKKQDLSDQPLEGDTATGQNGEKIILRNGQWVPL